MGQIINSTPLNTLFKHTEEKSDRTAKKNIQIHNNSKKKISGKSPYLENKQHASK